MEQNTLVGLFDTHAHPTDDRFDEDRAEVLARMRAGNMLCMCVGSDMASSEQSLKLARENGQIYAAVAYIRMTQRAFARRIFRRSHAG